jgi:hypothetical protein
VVASQRLPEQDADGPDVGRERRLLAGEALGRDVGQRAGYVAGSGQRLRLGELGETEVEQADLDLGPVGDEHVRRLDVPMDDPVGMGVRQALEDLRRNLDCSTVAQLEGPEAVAHRPAGYVLVRNVDVAVVAGVRVRAQASAMAQSRGGLGLPLGTRPGLALTRDDLQRDVEAVCLVAGKPDRARAAAAERLQGPVAAEHELAGRKGRDGCRHVRFGLAAVS